MGYGVLYMYLDLIFFIHIAGPESTCLIQDLQISENRRTDRTTAIGYFALTDNSAVTK